MAHSFPSQFLDYFQKNNALKIADSPEFNLHYFIFSMPGLPLNSHAALRSFERTPDPTLHVYAGNSHAHDNPRISYLMNRSFFLLAGTFALLSTQVSFAQSATPAALQLPPIFSDNMVLQHDLSVPIWGQAAPGEKVSVKFKTQEKSTVADGNGKWTAHLDPIPISVDPSSLSIITNSCHKEFKNVLVGEVWLCSGQSNMQITPKALEISDEIQDADNPQLRLFTAPRNGDGKWVACTTEVARNFSATAYYFGLNLWKQLKVPVGVIVAAEGSSSIETWMTPDSTRAHPQLVDQNGCSLVDEMEKFQQFYSKYPELSAEERERVFSQHCKSNYVFARSFLNKDGSVKMEDAAGILWHMSVIKPAFSFNKFIARISPYAIKGVVWYQGETNAIMNGDPQYAQKQQALIEGWRKLWNEGEFPFFMVQIPPCQSYPLLADFWAQQYQAVQSTPRTAMIATVDIGELKNAHPKNKRDIGSRLALLALRDAYGKKDIVASGPVYKSLQVKGKTVEVIFENPGTGLTTKDGQPPDWFEVAGADKKFQKAPAAIVGDKVVITSPLENTQYVRFAWDYLATPNLRNKEGFPVSPFNTTEAIFQHGQP